MTETSKEHFEHNVGRLAVALTKIFYFDWLREKEMFGAEEEQQLRGVVEKSVTAGTELREYGLSGVTAAFTVNSACFGICNYIRLVSDPRVTLALIDERWEAHKKSSIYQFLNEELIEKIAETEEQKEAAQKMCKLMEGVADDYSTCIALLITNGVDRFKAEYIKTLEELRVFEKKIKENGQEYLDVTLQITAAATLINDEMFPNAIYNDENIKATIAKLCDEIYEAPTPTVQTVDEDKEALDSEESSAAEAQSKNGNLEGQALLDFINSNAKSMDKEELVKVAGYEGNYEAFVSQGKRAGGVWPMPIPKGDEAGEEWVNNIGKMTRAQALFERFRDVPEDPENKEAIQNVLNNCKNAFFEALPSAWEYEKGVGHQYLIFSTHAMFVACSRGEYNKELFLETYKDNQLRGAAHNILALAIPDAEWQKDCEFTFQFDNYVYLTVNVMMNKFMNLADGGDREVFEESNEHFQEWVKLHNEYENKGYFDELSVIKQSLAATALAYSAIAVDPEGTKTIAFLEAAYAHMDAYNTKPMAVSPT